MVVAASVNTGVGGMSGLRRLRLHQLLPEVNNGSTRALAAALLNRLSLDGVVSAMNLNCVPAGFGRAVGQNGLTDVRKIVVHDLRNVADEHGRTPA